MTSAQQRLTNELAAIQHALAVEIRKLSSLPNLVEPYTSRWEAENNILNEYNSKLYRIQEAFSKDHVSAARTHGFNGREMAAHTVDAQSKVLDALVLDCGNSLPKKLKAQITEASTILNSILLMGSKFEVIAFLIYVSYLYPSHIYSKDKLEYLQNASRNIKELLSSEAVKTAINYLYLGSLNINTAGNAREKLALQYSAILDSVTKEGGYSHGLNPDYANVQKYRSQLLSASFLTWGSIDYPSNYNPNSSHFYMKFASENSKFLSSLTSVMSFYTINDVSSLQSPASDNALLTKDFLHELFPNENEIAPLILLPSLFNDKIKLTNVSLYNMTFLQHVVLATVFDNAHLLKALFDDYLTQNTADALLDFIRDNSLLGFAAGNGRVESVKFLLQFKVNIEQKFIIAIDNRITGALNQYAEHRLELTPVALAVAAASYISEEKARALMEALINAEANCGYKVIRLWTEGRGYYNARQAVERTAKISLFEFDKTGLLSKLLNEAKNQRGKQSTRMHYQYERHAPHSKANVNTMPATSSSSSHPSLEQPAGTDLQSENQALKAQVEQLWVLMSDLQQRMNALETNSPRPRHNPNAEGSFRGRNNRGGK